jgi:hypothetical protein
VIVGVNIRFHGHKLLKKIKGKGLYTVLLAAVKSEVWGRTIMVATPAQTVRDRG